MGFVTAAIVGAATSVIGGAVQANQADKAAGRAANDKRKAEAKVQELLDSRQQIINPYESTESLAGLAKDLSSQMTNPFANLGVATQAAEMQAEEADIALANTLATTRQAGLGAGGATSLAQAALRSKRGISASIEQQEAKNIMLRAQGAQKAQEARLAEGARVDTLTMQGESLGFRQEEARRMAMLDYRTDRMTAAEDRQAMAMQRRDQMIGSALGNTAGALMGFGAFGAQAQAGMGSSSGVATLPPMPSRTFNPNTNLNYLDYMGRNK